MLRNELKQSIILKLSPFQLDNWGYGANYIQDVAEKVLTPKEFNAYLIKSNRDASECEGQDGILFNGQYFDWREFGYHQSMILDAFLDYFTDSNLQRILKGMEA